MNPSYEIVNVALSGNSYDIVIGDGLIEQCADIIKDKSRDGKFLLITDENVAQHVLPKFQNHLLNNDIRLEIFTLPAGEKAKSWANLEKICEWLIEKGAERNDHIIALGGGVVGDITGFAAHIIKRGCNFIQIPTTLLAQVDSSVGGKTAINSKGGKNLVGAFHQPSLVLIDPMILDSLPPREIAAGFAEVVKYGLIQDEDFFNWCDANVEKFFAGDSATRIHAIKTSVTAKADIVAADEEERSGVRALLNLGHTFGHALEAESGFGDTLLHGEGVAMGMILAFRYSESQGFCPAFQADKIASLLAKAQLPTRLIDCPISCDGATLVGHMMHDKKMNAGNLPFLLARGIGQTFLANDVDINSVKQFLDTLIAEEKNL